MQVKNEIDQEGRGAMEESEALYLVAEDWGLLSRAVWKLRFWRAWPSWSLPPELLRLLVHPKWANERKPKIGEGIGFDQEF
eukprot:5161247-Pyramimonas_sp.AAC.1